MNPTIYGVLAAGTVMNAAFAVHAAGHEPRWRSRATDSKPIRSLTTPFLQDAILFEDASPSRPWAFDSQLGAR